MPSNLNTQTQSISGFAEQVALPDGVTGVFSNLTVTGTFTNSGVSSGNSPLIVTAATLALSATTYAGKTVVQKSASGCAISLPAATGTGNLYRIIVETTITSVGVVITTAGTDVFIGGIQVSKTSDGSDFNGNSTANKTITFNGTTTGGIAGTFVEFRDIDTGKWQVYGYAPASGVVATPFSN